MAKVTFPNWSLAVCQLDGSSSLPKWVVGHVLWPKQHSRTNGWLCANPMAENVLLINATSRFTTGTKKSRPIFWPLAAYLLDRPNNTHQLREAEMSRRECVLLSILIVTIDLP